MNKKEISEIKKQYTPKDCAISHICGCYVDGAKQKLSTFREMFAPLPEEEMLKYFELFRKSFSGGIGRSLHNLEFRLESEGSDGIQSLLLDLLASNLDDEELLDRYYDRIISSFETQDNFLILLIDAVYDIPGRASDELDMEDASENVYHFLHTILCPVLPDKPALSYDTSLRRFRERDRDFIVGMPALGYLFPAFNDRTADVHCMLYYVKNKKDLNQQFMENMLGCTAPLSAPDQHEVFLELVEATLQDSCDYETVRELYDQVHTLSESQRENPDPIVLGQPEMRHLLMNSGVGAEQMEAFDECYEQTIGEGGELTAVNMLPQPKYEVQTPDVLIRVSADRSDLVERRMIDGRPCLVIPITDEVRINGIRVKN